MSTIQQLLDLTKQVAVVTGGAKGIGLGIVERLHEAGASIAIADMDIETAATVAKHLNTVRAQSAIAVKTDVSQAAQVADIVSQTIEAFGAVTVLVNNAGIFPNQPMLTMSEADFDAVIDSNLKGVFLTTKAVADVMIKQGQGGKIINITSIDALHPSMVGLAHYDASKHGVWGFTKNVAKELAEHNIWVNAVAPGGIATPGVAKLQDPASLPPGVDMKAVTEAFMAKIPMHRMGEPEEIGNVVLFLASGLSSYMTGEQIVVDGGALLA
jgi:2-deoxy-D-gluconate 3-dehydrogenase